MRVIKSVLWIFYSKVISYQSNPTIYITFISKNIIPLQCNIEDLEEPIGR